VVPAVPNGGWCNRPAVGVVMGEKQFLPESRVSTPVPTVTKQAHRWKKGQSGNPAGRVKGSRSNAGILNEAIQAAQKRRAELKEPCLCATAMLLLGTPKDLWAKSCRTVDEHFARRAFLNDAVLTAFQKKRIPDLQQQTGNVQPVAVHIHYGHEQARVQVVQPLSHA